MDTYTYQIGNNLYINLTNRCSNRCAFCVRDQSAQYEGYSLWLEREPTAKEVTERIGDPKRYDEIVFCGYGEPTYRLDELLEICDYVHANGGKTRLNTNGHLLLIHGKEIAAGLKERMAGKLDGINVSMNAPDGESYHKLCRPVLDREGTESFEAMILFAVLMKEFGENVWFSVVDCIGKEQLSKCRRNAEMLGIPLRVREMIGEAKGV